MSKQDFGILISQPGVSVNNASTSQITLNTAYAQIKLDTQNSKSFQNILLLITNDPPEPVSPAQDAYTVVYKFAHGYNYIPSLETLIYVKTPPPTAAFYQKYTLDYAVIGQTTIDDEVDFYAVADKTYVYFIVDKFNDGNGSANLLTGTTIQIGCHVFLDEVFA